MKVNSRMVCPVRQADGYWTTEVKEFEEEIPDLGRHSMICNKCGEKSYPECRKWCPMEKEHESKS